jgi:enoyl-CoA hydratase/carnithine racemase
VTSPSSSAASPASRAGADYTTLDWSVSDGILTLTLDRPEQLNSFTVTMAEELVDAYDRASADDGVAAVVVTGRGRAFCAGMDLSGSDGRANVFGLDESLTPTLEDLEERLEDPEVVAGVRDTGGRVSLAVYRCTKPVIGAINGAAVEAASSWFLPRLVGISRALEWTYSADILTAQEALEGGLVRSVHPPEDLLDAAYDLARRFTANRSRVATALTRQMMWRNSAQPHPLEAHKVDSLAMFYTSTGDGKEGVAAFREKRDPEFTSRTSDMPPFHPWRD